MYNSCDKTRGYALARRPTSELDSIGRGNVIICRNLISYSRTFKSPCYLGSLLPSLSDCRWYLVEDDLELADQVWVDQSLCDEAENPDCDYYLLALEHETDEMTQLREYEAFRKGSPSIVKAAAYVSTRGLWFRIWEQRSGRITLKKPYWHFNRILELKVRRTFGVIDQSSGL